MVASCPKEVDDQREILRSTSLNRSRVSEVLHRPHVTTAHGGISQYSIRGNTTYSTFPTSSLKSTFLSGAHRQGQPLFAFPRKFMLHRDDKWGVKDLNGIFHHGNHLTIVSWRLALLLSIFIAILASFSGKITEYESFPDAEWRWDHNVYYPQHGFDAFPDNHSLTGRRDGSLSLIAQIVPLRELRGLADITSRTNRAYAREWGYDFARYNSGFAFSSRKACFEKVFALNAILESQSHNGSLPSLWPHASSVHYDSILLLPPDAVLAELDSSMLDNVQLQNKLVAIAGWNGEEKMNSKSDVILFNLKHRHAEAVAKLWLQLSSSQAITCGASNDLGLLVTAVAAVMEESENLQDLIESIQESEDFFVGDRFIKFVPTSVPGPRAAQILDNLQQSIATSQAVVESVCYRFYPKCEVLARA